MGKYGWPRVKDKKNLEFLRFGQNHTFFRGKWKNGSSYPTVGYLNQLYAPLVMYHGWLIPIVQNLSSQYLPIPALTKRFHKGSLKSKHIVIWQSTNWNQHWLRSIFLAAYLRHLIPHVFCNAILKCNTIHKMRQTYFHKILYEILLWV